MFNWFRRNQPLPEGPKTDFDAKGLKIGNVSHKSTHQGVTWTYGTYRHRKGTISQVMIRIIELDTIAKDYEAKWKQEKHVLKFLSHRNILKVIGLFKEFNPNRYLIVFERAKMTLTTYVAKLGHAVPEYQAQIWMGQMAQALNYVHEMGFCHEQINPDSMLITGPNRCLLTRFTEVERITRDRPNTTKLANEPAYRSPEMADRTKPFAAHPAEVWAYGCTLYFLLKGKPMFKDPLTEHVDTNSKIEAVECDECRSILQSIIIYDPSKRLSMADIVRHSFFTTKHPTSPHHLFRPEPIPTKDYGKDLRHLGPSTGFFLEKMSAAGYSVQFKIGEGSFGVVYRGMKRTPEGEIPVALKVIRGLNKKEQKEYRKRTYPIEVKIAETFVHPNIIRVYDVFRETNTKQRKHDRRAFIWMELAERDLHTAIVQAGRLDENTTQKYIRDIVRGLKFLYDNNIAHRDIKPNNFLVMADGTAKVTDFSVSRESSHDAVSDTCTGNPNYMSPQVASLNSNNPFKSDVWSLGIVVFECLSGRLPDWHPEIGNRGKNFEEYDNLALDVREEIKNTDILSCVTQMLSLSEGTRYDMAGVYNDPWMFGTHAIGGRGKPTKPQVDKKAGLVGSDLSSFSSSQSQGQGISKSWDGSFPGRGGPGGRGFGRGGFGGRGGRGGRPDSSFSR